MGGRVLKFGGTSVSSPDRLANVALLVGRAFAGAGLRDPRDRGTAVVVVVSALAGVTNELAAAFERAFAGETGAHGLVSRLRERHKRLLAQTVGESDDPAASAAAWRPIEAALAALGRRLAAVAAGTADDAAAHDDILATGERLAVPLVVAVLRAAGLPAVPVDAAELIRTDDSFGAAAVDLVSTAERVRARIGHLADHVVPVVTGFLGSTADGRTTLLGRGASDYTAGIIGAALDADAVEIWTDVDGLMSADPRLVPGAVTLPRASFAEATELALRGARVLHPRTLEPLRGRRTRVWIGNTGRPGGPGTELTESVTPLGRAQS